MSDEGPPWYAWNRKPPARRTKRAVGELLWETHVDHVFWRAELFDDGPYGFDVRLFSGGEFFASHRLLTRQAAVAWANEQRGDIEKGWKE